MRNKLIAVAVVAAMAPAGAARADTSWLSGNPDMVQKAGRWFIGAGVAGGAYHMPDWTSTTAAAVPLSALPPNVGPASFSTDVSFVAPGGTIGYVLPDGSLPAWLGKSVRLSFTGAYLGGRGGDSRSTPLSPTSTPHYTTVDGRAGLAVFVGVPFRVGERLRVEQEGFELALRLASDVPVGPGLALSPSLGIFGGRTRTNFDFTGNLIQQATGVSFAAHTITERLRARKVGLDAGLAATWRPWSNIALTLAGRGGVVWTRASLTASDCFQFGFGATQCTTPAGTAPTGGAFATSARDRESEVGFVGTVHGALSYDGGWVVLSVGGFFTWESAVPGVRNPVNTVGGAVVGAQIAAPASVRFDSGWKGGGFVTIRFFFN